MWRPRPGEVGRLIDPVSITECDGRGPPMGEWDRARRSYRALVGEYDPASAAVAAGAVDLRPGGSSDEVVGPRIVSGPQDLQELRSVVESITGPGTWPRPHPADGEAYRAALPVARPAAVLALVAALDGVVEDRTGMWRTWRTTVELVAAALADVDTLTLEAVVVTPTELAGRDAAPRARGPASS